MSVSEKEQELLDLLTEANTLLTVGDIARELFISQPTARRYLAELAKKGYIVRTHGGAMINYKTMQVKNVPLYLRITSMSEEKNHIASEASKLIRDGYVIFLDASSTCFHLLPYLKNFHELTVCTNSLKTAITLAEMHIRTISFGGDVVPANLSCNSNETVEMINDFNADVLFFSCDALSDDGILSDNSKEASYLRKQYMKHAKVKALLIDDTKLHKQCWHSFSSLEEVDYCFCNTPLPENLAAMLDKRSKV